MPKYEQGYILSLVHSIPTNNKHASLIQQRKIFHKKNFYSIGHYSLYYEFYGRNKLERL